MIQKKYIIFIIIIIVLIFLFPKENGTWLVSREDDYYCKCFGFEYIFERPDNYNQNQKTNSVCFGIPYSCGDADTIWWAETISDPIK